jgi:hypothetical protein
MIQEINEQINLMCPFMNRFLLNKGVCSFVGPVEKYYKANATAKLILRNNLLFSETNTNILAFLNVLAFFDVDN